MKIRLVRLVVGVATVSAVLAPGAAGAATHPCHEYSPDGNHLIKWAEYEGARYTTCMVKEIVGP